MEFYEANREAPFADEEIIELPTEKTDVQNYYAGKTILITGGTGFLGTLLIEKLLRCCPNLKKLVIILRPKRGKSLLQRARDHFKNVIFEKMRRSNPDYWKKVEIVYGDCEKPYYDVHPDEWCRLQKEVNVIFHAAATIRFDEHIKTSYNINVAATKYLLKLAEGAHNLSAFVYISTAYSQSHLSHIEEKFYRTPFDDEQMMQLLEELDDFTLACMTPILLGGRFNTYVMTKAMAENVMKPYVGKLPVAIFRPTIVVATMEEPLVCWTNSMSGATGVFVGTAAGFLRTLYCDPSTKAEIIPADRVINFVLTIPLHIQGRKAASLQHSISTVTDMKVTRNRQPEYVPIYNYAATGQTISWREEIQLLDNTIELHSLQNFVVMWCYHLRLEKRYTFWLLQYYLLHLLPLPVFIMMEKISKLPPRVWNGYIRLYYYTELYSFFMVNTWTFSWKNSNDLISSASKDDKILFNSDNDIDWASYLFNMSRGVPYYLMKMRWNDYYNRLSIKAYCVRFMDTAIIWSFKGLLFWLAMRVLQNIIGSIL